MNTCKALFVAGYLLFVAMGHSVSAQTVAELRERVEFARTVGTLNSRSIGILEEQVKRNSEDIRDLTRITTDLAASMNRTNGVGIAVAGIGTIIIVMQMVGLAKKKTP